jgi:hypothetical protein
MDAYTFIFCYFVINYNKILHTLLYNILNIFSHLSIDK